MRTGVANLPLHYGACPKWLFGRMKKLSGAISEIIVYEYGQDEFLKRLSDPFWFQSFSCVLGFDWHSSGVTTTVTGALKESLKQNDLGLTVCGGKGKTSRKAPTEIEKASDLFSLTEKKKQDLVYASKMSAKIDNSCVQDSYNLYHHCFIFTEKGNWCVIQQGLNYNNRYARRYHWLNTNNFVEDPQSAICCDKKQEKVLNMVARQSKEAQKVSVDLVKENIGKKLLRQNRFTEKRLDLPPHHGIGELRKSTASALIKAYEIQPKNYEELLAIRGIGPKAVRALALISELVYGKEPSWKDPVKFSFAHGGKDGIPYPVDRKLFDSSIDMLRNAVNQAKLGSKEKMFAIRRLNEFI